MFYTKFITEKLDKYIKQAFDTSGYDIPEKIILSKKCCFVVTM